MEGDNLYIRPNGRRNCRTCKLEKGRIRDKTRDIVAERHARRERERQQHGYVPPSFTIDSGYVYKLTCIPTGAFYIGKTQKTVGKRWVEHCNKASQGSPKLIHQAIREHGADAFRIDVLDTADTSLDLSLSELAWIKNEKPALNMTTGGLGVSGLKWSEDSKRKNSERAKALWADPIYREQQASKMQAGRDAYLAGLGVEEKAELARKRAEGNRKACVMGGGSKGAMRARTHCKHGHPFAEFEYIRSDGVRQCRRCMSESTQRHRLKKKAKTAK